jgi:hypothetical protein
LSSCNLAADTLIEWFGPRELKSVVGGERWWQVRGLDGLDAEWIAEKDYLKAETVDLKGRENDRKLSSDEEDILKMECLESVMVSFLGYVPISASAHDPSACRSSTFMEVRCSSSICLMSHRHHYEGGYFWGSISSYLLGQVLFALLFICVDRYPPLPNYSLW